MSNAVLRIAFANKWQISVPAPDYNYILPFYVVLSAVAGDFVLHLRASHAEDALCEFNNK